MRTGGGVSLKRLALGLCVLAILLAWPHARGAWAAPHQHELRQTVPPIPPTATPGVSPTAAPTPVPEIPEPSTLLLLASGLGGLTGYLALRRAAKH